MERSLPSDEEDKRSNHSQSKKSIGSINALLQAALEVSSIPGEGDEEPEVLEAPGGGGPEITGKVQPSVNDVVADEKTRQDILLAKQRAIEEEERRVAEMTFLPEDLVPNDRMEDKAKYIPLRLSYGERKGLRLVAANINVSNYTNSVDQTFKNKAKRHHTQLQSIVSFLTGVITAVDYDKGRELMENRNFVHYERDIQNFLEIARRYKVTNPEKMRSEYGKLIYLMQDADSEEIKQLLGVSIKKPIKTVYDILTSCGPQGVQVLRDPRLDLATQEILATKGKARHQIQFEIKRKEKAAQDLCRQYCSPQLPEEVLRTCLYSISDNHSFLNSNLRPIQQCIDLLKQYFSPGSVRPAYSLAIHEGQEGARLTHDHERQFNYVLQSLTLWASIIEDMFRLWYLSECDMLSEETAQYELRHTGQGLQRVKESPLVYRAMHEILARTKMKLGGWVGSSVVHLGDNNVPNTLVFIDKYTQVPRILGPLIKTLENLESACESNDGLTRYIQASYGGIEKAKMDILHDFFTHAFDGSGGDNFFDAGSCIDGRLTSAWNWCTLLATKPYYPLFKLTGFLSFDGQFDG